MASFPIPIGVTASFSGVPASTNTAQFFMPAGPVTVTFQPADDGFAGTLTMYDSGANVILTMLTGGYTQFQAPIGGGNYYFSCTQPIKLVAATVRNI